MEGKTILLGKGSFGAREGAKYLKLFGLEGKVKLAEVELSNAVPALKNGQIDGFVTAGSYPAPNVIEAAASAGARVLSLSDEHIKLSKRTRLEIPAGTYAGQSSEITTTSLPVVAFATTDMDDATAYALTKTFWEAKASMGSAAKWWNGVSLDMLDNIVTEIHPGATIKRSAPSWHHITDHFRFSETKMIGAIVGDNGCPFYRILSWKSVNDGIVEINKIYLDWAWGSICCVSSMAYFFRPCAQSCIKAASHGAGYPVGFSVQIINWVAARL